MLQHKVQSVNNENIIPAKHKAMDPKPHNADPIMKATAGKIFGLLDKVLTLVTGGGMVLILILIAFDIYQSFNEQDVNMEVLGPGASNGSWHLSYIKNQVVLFLGALSILSLIVFSEKYRHNKALLTAKRILVFSLAALFIYLFCAWQHAGCHH